MTLTIKDTKPHTSQYSILAPFQLFKNGEKEDGTLKLGVIWLNARPGLRGEFTQERLREFAYGKIWPPQCIETYVSGLKFVQLTDKFATYEAKIEGLTSQIAGGNLADGDHGEVYVSSIDVEGYGVLEGITADSVGAAKRWLAEFGL